MEIDLAGAEAPIAAVRAQVCVIGAGIAGLTLARKLVERGVDVAVVEAGGREIEEEGQRLFAEAELWGQAHVGTIDGRARVFAGTSVWWGGQVLGMSRDAAAAWPIAWEELAHFFADMFAERNPQADVQSIIYQFEALAKPDADDHHSGIACPTIILTGSEDATHSSAAALQARIPGCDMKILYGAGHACQIEQPWHFDRYMIEFFKKHGLFPGAASA